MDARYEGPTLSRFLSQDPMFIQGAPENWQNTEAAEPQYAALNGFVKSSNSVYLASPQNLNPYSYVDENPLKYTDPSGKCIEDACVLETFPFWAPYVVPLIVSGTTAAAEGGALLLRNSEEMKYQPFDTRRLVSMPEPSMTDPQLPNGGSGWKGGLVVLGIVASAVADIYDQYKKAKEFGEEFNREASPQPSTSGGSNGNTYIGTSRPQSNASQSPSTNRNSSSLNPFTSRLYVTPNGAVINWFGGIIAPASSAKH
jgi:hypothetical protein